MKKYNEDDVKSLTKVQISEKLKEEGILFDPASKKDELIAKLLDIDIPEPDKKPEDCVEESVEPHADEEIVETSVKDDETKEESDDANPEYTGEKDDADDSDNSDDKDLLESDEEALESDEEEDERFSKIQDLADDYLAAINNLPTEKSEYEQPEGSVKAVFSARSKEKVGTIAVRATKRF